MKFKEPITPDELKNYYDFIYRQLYEGWRIDRGAEILSDDDVYNHKMALNDVGQIVTVGQVSVSTPIPSIRHFAYDFSHKKAGMQIIDLLETMVQQAGRSMIASNVREPHVSLFENAGYEIIGPGGILWGKLPQYIMQKEF